ncbi:hypothetical protein [Thalassotalea crassostreae]|uniref:hypothetical protein n=1 Tax=Thalassotalea crassostreae TaxID=1763536 RepID=UPI000838EAB1|nr:hypothetical protein [Thalassotalea crassostreae]
MNLLTRTHHNNRIICAIVLTIALLFAPFVKATHHHEDGLNHGVECQVCMYSAIDNDDSAIDAKPFQKFNAVSNKNIMTKSHYAPAFNCSFHARAPPLTFFI